MCKSASGETTDNGSGRETVASTESASFDEAADTFTAWVRGLERAARA